MTVADISQCPDVRLALDRVIFDSALDAMLIADDARRYVDVNPAACELFGVVAEQPLGRRIDDFSDARFDGVARLHNAPHRHLSILRDVTERKRSEELLLERDRTRELFVAIRATLPR